ncbi:MAG TPA: polymorphic toxin-type HINT domain-containing protein, partial [Chthonomonadaceae bacterium]|nr:polymorphic toxin-type HINT domain-containing protein [Chthonomonadaceae bacterium]
GEELAILARLCDGPGCFVAGTPVQTIVRGEDGRFHLLVKPIEKVHQGNLVLARDEKTGRTQVRRVLRTTVRHVDKVLAVALADAKTHKVVERITATREHPFYVRGKGFTPAGGLAVGNAIVTRAGPRLVVQSVTWRRRAEGYTVHNFVVEDDHSYFVGTHGGGAWVHNPPCWRIHTVAPDWAVKGAHITYDGVELAVRPAADGAIVFKPVFSGGGRAADAAAADAQQLLGDREFVTRMLDRVRAAKPYVTQFPNDGGVGRSYELHFLEHALQQLAGQ